MGLLRLIFGAIVIWFVWRLLDGWMGGGRPPRQNRTSGSKGRPADDRLGEYVDYEEIKD